MTKALVLGGGGVTGIAWELGVVAALADAGIDLVAADLIVGTSAGSTVAAQLTGGRSLDELVAAQLSPPDESGEIAVDFDVEKIMATFAVLWDSSLPLAERRAKVGAIAVDTSTVPEAVRREVIVARLGRDAWPVQPIVLTAVDVASGEFVTFDAGSGVSLIDAVAASCAVPGIWPPVTIGDRRFMDGGVRSSLNADLAAEHERALLLTPMGADLVPGLDKELVHLEQAGCAVLVVAADPEAAAAMGTNALDPAMRGVALGQGRRQGEAAVESVRSFWSAGA